MDRNETTSAIRKALRDRSGKAWSVRGGTGTAAGWIRISAPPARCGEYGRMTDADATELHALLGLTYYRGTDVNVPDSHDYYTEYVARAEGRTPEKFGTPYWD